MSNWSSRRKVGEEWERENIWGDIGYKFFRTEQYNLWIQNTQQIPNAINRKEYRSEYIIFNNQIPVQILKAARDLKKIIFKMVEIRLIANLIVTVKSEVTEWHHYCSER